MQCVIVGKYWNNKHFKFEEMLDEEMQKCKAF
jgi:hypothetical protein